MGLFSSEKVDKAICVFNVIIKIIFVAVIILIIGVIIWAVQYIFKQFHQIDRNTNPDVIEEVEDRYKMPFQILESKADEKGWGNYKAFCKSDSNVAFMIIKDKQLRIVRDDFHQRYRKYYMEKWDEEEKKKAFTIQEKKEPYEKDEFIAEYQFWVELNSYEEIEEAVTNVYDFYQYARQNAKLPHILLNGGMIRQGSYISGGYQYLNDSLENLIKQEQKEYAEYFYITDKVNNTVNETI